MKITIQDVPLVYSNRTQRLSKTTITSGRLRQRSDRSTLCHLSFADSILNRQRAHAHE